LGCGKRRAGEDVLKEWNGRVFNPCEEKVGGRRRAKNLRKKGKKKI